MSDSSFSIDIQEKYTRICDSKSSGEKIELLTLATKETTPTFFANDTGSVIEKQATVITQLAAGMQKKKKIVNIILPDSHTYSRIMEIPILKEKELLSAIRYQSDEFIPMSIDETNLDIEILREDKVNKKYLVLIVAVPKKIVSQVEKALDLAGFLPGSLENELTTTGRIASEKLFKTKKAGATLIFNFGYATSSLYLIDGQSGLMIAARSFKIGLDLLARDVKVNLNVDEKKARELLKTIGFAKSGSYDIDAIITPVSNEIMAELNRFIAAAKEKFAMQVDMIYTFNYDCNVAQLDRKLTELLSIPTFPLTIKDVLLPNPVYQSASNDITSFVSAIAGSL